MSRQVLIYKEKSGKGGKKERRDCITNVVIKKCWSEVIHLAPLWKEGSDFGSIKHMTTKEYSSELKIRITKDILDCSFEPTHHPKEGHS